MSEPSADLNIHLRLERRERRNEAVRIKQTISMLTTSAYAVLAGAAWKPIFEHAGFSLVNALFTGVAVFALGLSIYIAPKGEFDG